jgi:hypothetical protein
VSTRAQVGSFLYWVGFTAHEEAILIEFVKR